MGIPSAIFASALGDPGFTPLDAALAMPFVLPPLLVAIVWAGIKVWRRQFQMAQWFLFMGYMSLVVAYFVLLYRCELASRAENLLD